MPTYAAVALLAAVLFFLLHHVGNRLPDELARQRFQAEFEAGRLDEKWVTAEYCQLLETVLAGARSRGAVRRAVVLRTFEPYAPDAGGGRHGERVVHDSCRELVAASNGADVDTTSLKPRYWWGSKALYAIALRHLSVQQIRELTRFSTRAAYLLLALSVLWFAPRALPAAAPLIALGAFASGIDHWADAANGVPYLWTVVSAAVLAWALRGPPPAGAFSGRAPAWCFGAGTVSSYLWLGEGHTFLAFTWIGLLVWFGGDVPGAAERTRRAVSCVALYVAGFAACYGLGLLVKAVVWGPGRLWRNVWDEVVVTVKTSGPDPSAGLVAHFGAYVDLFYATAWPGWLPAGVVPTSLAASSLAVVLGFAVFRARGGRPDPLRGVLWIGGLMAVNALSFLIQEDIPQRASRFVFVPLALCGSCLFVSVRTMSRRLSSAVLGVVLVVSGAVSWYAATFDSRALARLFASVGDARPEVVSGFDVHLDGNRLVYLKDDCGAGDVDARFFLHAYPADEADLPDHRRPHGFDNLDFAFETYGFRVDGRCAAARTLPEYGVADVRTGQLSPAGGEQWSGRVSVAGRRAVDELAASVAGARPVISSGFDVYLDGDRLVYLKDDCGAEDVGARFLLHLHPVDEADLPDARRPHGFDNLDFAFAGYGFRSGGRCAAARGLPGYGIAVIRTGQFAPGQDPAWDETVSWGTRWW